MEYQILKAATEGDIVLLTLSRPQALNALNSRFFDEMDDFLDALARKTNIRALIITGEGKAFVAGADIAEMVNMSGDQARAFSRRGQEVFNKIGKMPFPVIAAVNGFALGGGLELAMACDFRIASSNAKFGQPEVNLGLIPGYAGTQRLARLTNLADAMLLLTTGEAIDANTALSMRLVQKVTEPENLLEECKRIANVIASKGPMAVKLVKRVTRDGLQGSFSDGELMESKLFGDPFGNEGTEGMKAFLEKRKPNW
ncbi:MAG TPA: enoyl-CoA hydratase-related protein [Lentimicrobium sp.]|nr:enoyl-CoA hydratase-related protein [Lentimicrobium sp.]